MYDYNIGPTIYAKPQNNRSRKDHPKQDFELDNLGTLK